ncbi:Uridine-ribohydrolase 1 isoform 3 [Cocos nucifera]|nr:Uridine-ribohydrolase 1 isoform 3 [Cocos nucifera]
MESNDNAGSLENSGNHRPFVGPEKVIIDTDPGIDDSMAIMMAFQTPEIEVLGLTTIFGNVSTEDATSNALLLAIKRDSSFARKVKRVVILGGAFFASGNVNPAAEANIYGDPEAADIVFTCGADVVVVGINITTQVRFTDEDLLELRNSKGRHAQFICNICKFYRDWHVKSDGVFGIFLHDPVSFAALVRSDLFTFRKGVVRVETQGICVGHTLMDQGLKKWNTSNPWSGYSPISVAWTVDVPGVLAFIKERLMKP